MPLQWVLCPCISLFILRWSGMTGDIITTQGLRPRHRELLHLYRCDPIGWGGSCACSSSMEGTACLSCLSLYISTNLMTEGRLCAHCACTQIYICEAITGHPVTSGDSAAHKHMPQGGGCLCCHLVTSAKWYYITYPVADLFIRSDLQ